MQSSFIPFHTLTALAVCILSGGIAASAQTSQDRTPTDTPTFHKEIPAAAPTNAPSPVVVLDAARAVPADPKVVPPPPHLVAAAAPGTIVVAPRPQVDAGYTTSAAAVSTPLQVNSAFGYRWGRKHTGIDFQASWGDPVGTSMAGTVAFAGIKHGYGNVIIVDHGDGISTYYAHLSSIFVGVGQAVAARQVIGAVGSTGRSTGPHLHYEVRINGKPINPNAAISKVDGEYFVNGQPLNDAAAPAAAVVEGEPSSRLVEPAEDAGRPRRVTRANGIETMTLLYGQNSLSAY